MKKTNTPTTRATLRLFYRVSLEHKQEAVLSLLHHVGGLGINVLVPYFASKALAAIATGSSDSTRYIVLLSIAAAVGVATNYIGFSNLMKLQAKAIRSLHDLALTTLLRRGVRFHSNSVGGKLVSDAIDFASAYGALLTGAYNTGVSFALTFVIGLAIVAWQSWQLGLYLAAIVAITIGWAYLESRTRYTLRGKRLAATKTLTAHLSDTIVNAQTVKLFAAEERELAHSRRLSLTLRNLRIRDWTRAGRSGSRRVGFLLAALVGLLLVIDAVSANNPGIIGTSIFAFTYTLGLILRLFEINNLTRQIEEAFLQASPMTNIIGETPEICDEPDAGVLHVDKGDIWFRDVSFAYQEHNGSQQIFRRLNLHIRPGERVGLVGPSGGGKTTLTRLLLRFDDIQDGTILIDGQDIRRVSQASLRDAVGYVPQEPLLFHRTLRENISYGRPDASESAVEQASSLAHALDFIHALPKQFDTTVGERGVKLSGGQRQRVAIARAILKDAPILILDEATSALDSESEQLVQQALWELLSGRTALVIAHRLSTIQKMDRIIVLDNGRIVEEGSHAQLLARGGTYARLWAHQSGGFIDE